MWACSGGPAYFARACTGAQENTGLAASACCSTQSPAISTARQRPQQHATALACRWPPSHKLCRARGPGVRITCTSSCGTIPRAPKAGSGTSRTRALATQPRRAHLLLCPVLALTGCSTLSTLRAGLRAPLSYAAGIERLHLLGGWQHIIQAVSRPTCGPLGVVRGNVVSSRSRIL